MKSYIKNKENPNSKKRKYNIDSEFANNSHSDKNYMVEQNIFLQ